MKKRSIEKNLEILLSSAEFFEHSYRLLGNEEYKARAEECRRWAIEKPDVIMDIRERMSDHFGLNQSIDHDFASFLEANEHLSDVEVFLKTCDHNPFWGTLWLDHGATPQIVSAALGHTDETVRVAALRTGLATQEEVSEAFLDKSVPVVLAAIRTGMARPQDIPGLINHDNLSVRLAAYEKGWMTAEEFVETFTDRGYVFMRE